MEELNEQDRISIFGDMVTLEKVKVEENNQEENSNVERDPLIAKIDEFFRSRKLRIQLPNDGSSVDLFGRALGQKNFDVQLSGLTSGASEGEISIFTSNNFPIASPSDFYFFELVSLTGLSNFHSSEFSKQTEPFQMTAQNLETMQS